MHQSEIRHALIQFLSTKKFFSGWNTRWFEQRKKTIRKRQSEKDNPVSSHRLHQEVPIFGANCDNFSTNSPSTKPKFGVVSRKPGRRDRWHLATSAGWILVARQWTACRRHVQHWHRPSAAAQKCGRIWSWLRLAVAVGGRQRRRTATSLKDSRIWC